MNPILKAAYDSIDAIPNYGQDQWSKLTDQSVLICLAIQDDGDVEAIFRETDSDTVRAIPLALWVALYS